MSEKVQNKLYRYKIINIRGTGGSGKSHLVMKFMKRYGAKPIRGPSAEDDLLDGGSAIEAYHVRYKGQDVYLIGRYTTPTGGCDGIKTQDEVCDRVRKYAKKGHVIFEGFLISGLYKRYRALSQELGGIIWAYLDTPLETCIVNIGHRNEERGNAGKEFNRENTRAKYKATVASRRKAEEDGEVTATIRHKKPLTDLCALLDG